VAGAKLISGGNIMWVARRIAITLAVITPLAVVSGASAAAGDLDPSFGGDGRVVTSLSPQYDWATAVAVQADGKVVVAGAALNGARFAVLRYNVDGTPDLTFGGDGNVITDFTLRDDEANAVAIQADGKIVVAGEVGFGSLNPKFGIARYNADGTLDSGFSGNGLAVTDFTPKEDFANGVAIQADGKIVAEGPAGVKGTNPRFAVARYNTDGTMDSGFGGDGKVTTDLTPHTDWANGIVIRGDGTIVVGGVLGSGSANARFGLVCYNGDGTLNTGFGGDGKVATDLTPRQDQVVSLALQADGKVVAGGIAGQFGLNPRFGLARYNSDGTLDSGFSGDGKLTTDFTPKDDDAFGIGIQADGKIVAGGVAGSGGANPTFAIARYDTAGTLDATFSGDGRARTDFTPRLDWAFGLAVQADGNVVLAGQSGWGSQNANIALARYLGS
jgi:serralysin